MVKALYGKCDGLDISFTRDETGRWTTTVPASPTGVYVLELWAEDYAGNVGYFATVEFTYDSSNLCVVIKVLDVGAGFTVRDVMSVLCSVEPAAELDGPLVASELPGDRLQTTLVQCEVC